MEIKIKRLRAGAHLPARATGGSAGFDLRACLEADMHIASGERALVPTGISVELPGPEYAAMIYARSGLAYKKGLALANGVGVVDSDYRGEMMVAMVNLSNETVRIAPGERVAQMVVTPVAVPEIVEFEELADTRRGAGGFGSTGAK